MSKLTKLLGKPKDIELEGDTYTFKPLTVDNIDLIMDLESESKRAEAMKKIIKITLKDAVPDATDEEVNNVAIQHFQKLTEAIMNVNGLDNNAKSQQKSKSPLS